MISNILVKRLFIALKTKWFFSFIKGKTLSLASYEVLTNFKKTGCKVNTILDVGANQGQFQKVANDFFPNAKIYSFEPIPEMFNLLNKKQLKGVKNFNMALGNQKSTLEFNQNEYGHSSSFLKVHKDNDNFPSKNVTKIKVNVEKIDNLANIIKFTSPTLLKLDVQGYELEALKGSINTLKRDIDYIIVESNFEELYENQPNFSEINTFLNMQNFYLKTILDFNLGKKLNYIEADFLYEKKKLQN